MGVEFEPVRSSERHGKGAVVDPFFISTGFESELRDSTEPDCVQLVLDESMRDEGNDVSVDSDF